MSIRIESMQSQCCVMCLVALRHCSTPFMALSRKNICATWATSKYDKVSRFELRQGSNLSKLSTCSVSSFVSSYDRVNCKQHITCQLLLDVLWSQQMLIQSENKPWKIVLLFPCVYHSAESPIANIADFINVVLKREC